ncbi:MAG: MFS transporter [Gammaproteobacteria bacterium]|nr:MFS transporter [Gammaproteobacteria bacterium]
MIASRARRYGQFAIIVVAAGAIYPLMYLRQNFEISVLEALRITASDLGELYSLLGFVFAVAYLPSGWLADRYPPRLLMACALAAVGLLGFWFSTYPSLFELRLIFLGWGLAGGLCFWASLIKAVNLLAGPREQGRFFGVLDGGRGLVEALLASIAVLLFRSLSAPGDHAAVRLAPVIHMYAAAALVIAVLVFLLVENDPDHAPSVSRRGHPTPRGGRLLAELGLLVRIPELWLLAVVMMIGQALFWVTYSISAFLQVNFGLSALAAGSVVLTKLWMRPVGGITIGFLGDWLSKELLLAWLLALASTSLIAICFADLGGNMPAIVGIVLVIGYLTYAIKGLYWALLDHCPVPRHIVGLAIGLVSFVGYLPDVLLPLYDGFLSRQYPRAVSFQIYFTSIALCGYLGAVLCLVFWRRSRHRHAALVPTASESATETQ